jgi:hypothetical protein
MPLITITDLETNIYPEIVAQITRNNNDIVATAISTAVQEAKMYLGRYDLPQLFGTEDVEPTVNDDLLKCLLKDIACWHLLRLANPGADYHAYRTAYHDAIGTLKNIMSGQAQPEGWPYADTSANEFPPGDTISWNSNPRRSNHY